MTIIAFFIMLTGAAFAGLFVKQLNATKKWFAFEICAIGAHGLMLVAMALHSIGFHLPGLDMQTIGVLASLPMIGRGVIKALLPTGGDAEK